MQARESAERPQTQRQAERARHLRGGGKAETGSSRRDARSGSLQRLISRCGHFHLIAMT